VQHRSKAKCSLCGDLRVEESGDNQLLFDLRDYEGWVFGEWGAVCGSCARKHERSFSTLTLRQLVERREQR
jgi:hypothetical protein